MKVLFAAIAVLCSIPAVAAEHCSIGLAKKYADSVIAVEVNHNNLDGRLVYSRSSSNEYTLEYVNEQIRLIGNNPIEYLNLKKELEARPHVHIYRLQYSLKRANGLNLGFYYVVRLNNYDRGCSLESLNSD